MANNKPINIHIEQGFKDAKFVEQIKHILNWYFKTHKYTLITDILVTPILNASDLQKAYGGAIYSTGRANLYLNESRIKSRDKKLKCKYTLLFTIFHELRHISQMANKDFTYDEIIAGMNSLDMITKLLKFTNAKALTYYRQLPWEKDADTHAKIVIKKWIKQYSP